MLMWGGNSETFEEIAATIAHEIKNPLALALANLDIIKISDIIEKELFKVNRLVLDLIHISRADEHEEEFDLCVMLRDLIDEYRHSYENVTFEGPSEQRVNFFGLKKKMRLVFTNLFNNAIDAVPEGGRIETEILLEPYAIRVLIKDNGSGLSDEASMSGNFFTTKANGTGVGLRYCRSTTAQHGGRFTLKNRPEGGCVAAVELPKRWA